MRNFWLKRNELAIQEGCIVRGERVVVPKKLQRDTLKYLHLNHCGVVATKAFARSYAWWPGIDEDIEVMISNCDNCQETKNNPPRAQIENWEIPQNPWTRLHIDFAGPFRGQVFLIVVDATSKWIEVSKVSSTTLKRVIIELRRLFATFGTPKTIVSDNDTSFKSAEMAEFTKKNGIKQVFVAPYHPAANGQAERAVQTTKRNLKVLIDGNWEEKMSRFLLKQHTTPSATTGLTPAEIMMNRKLHIPLDIMKPNKEEKNPTSAETRAGTRKFKINETVCMRIYQSKTGPKWARAIIIKKTGPLSYQVRERNTGLVHRRHVNQLIKIKTGPESEPKTLSTPKKKPMDENQTHYPLRSAQFGWTIVPGPFGAPLVCRERGQAGQLREMKQPAHPHFLDFALAGVVSSEGLLTRSLEPPTLGDEVAGGLLFPFTSRAQEL
ncbi:uncharacterized protein K02A2.6-like [Diprion similis]|uniref:uncharacterized protein K02A2.6-like n=1 Tax=Diprion similis TaxID=362088 RepID=UPI001EF8331D|nr:uncharacterized protein K02A2.6-like [Diprion similis]